MDKTTREWKVSQFATTQGDIPGHSLLAHQHAWMQSRLRSIVFETFDDVARMKVETLVHWTKFTNYTKRKWPASGSVVAVLLDSGDRISCDSLSVGHGSNEAYARAPIICRDVCAVVALGSRETLLEVAGVSGWAHSRRDAAATAKYLIDPFERDNALYTERTGGADQSAVLAESGATAGAGVEAMRADGFVLTFPGASDVEVDGLIESCIGNAKR